MLRTKWMKIINEKYPALRIFKNSSICSLHFQQTDIIGSVRKSLRYGALPFVNLKDHSPVCGKYF
jgi:hypothetical protein